MAEISSLGKYEIRRELGRGAMGVVYEGYDPFIKRVVALKTIRADQLSGGDSENVIARFRREAQAAGRLSHPNIVSIYDFGEEGGAWFIAMEFVKGRELKECFEANERFSSATIVKLMSQILEALDYSHRQGVIHRDIKPANIFMLPDGSVKVADFGIAHIEASNLTQVGAVMGTPAYMSPEQIMGLPVDGRSDLFSAGVILYQFLTGERPFSGSAATTMQKVLKEDPLPPSSLNVQAPLEMDGIVRKALAKRPEDRYQTAGEFAAAIRAAVPEQIITNTDPTLISTVARAPAAPVERTLVMNGAAAATSGAPSIVAQPTPIPKPKSKSQTLVIGTVVGVSILVLGAGAWFTFQRQAADGARSVQSAPSQPVATTAPVAAPAHACRSFTQRPNSCRPATERRGNASASDSANSAANRLAFQRAAKLPSEASVWWPMPRFGLVAARRKAGSSSGLTIRRSQAQRSRISARSKKLWPPETLYGIAALRSACSKTRAWWLAR